MLASLSIDLDGLEHYHRLHGLADPPPGGGDPVYGKAVERFGEMCAELGVRGTAFCVGRSLSRPGPARAVRRLAEAGHEIANHTLSHDYALTRRTPEVIAAEVRGGGEAVAAAAGRAPSGFRAPGYTVSAPLLAALCEQGYRYDSSVFPALPYYGAKALAMAAMTIAGRRTRAVLDRPRVLLAPREPYRPSRSEPYARGDLPVVELPLTTGLLGFPLIGTSVASLPRLARLALAGTGRLPLFNLELHGVDLLDASDASAALAARQRDLLIPAGVKLRRIAAFVRALAGREWVTLEEAAERLAPGLAPDPPGVKAGA
jgi:peptidoglycan-N-acetylglucosamine deacetylase